MIVRQENEIQETCIGKGNAISILIVDSMTDKIALFVVKATFFIDYDTLSAIRFCEMIVAIIDFRFYTPKTRILKRIMCRNGFFFFFTSSLAA